MSNKELPSVELLVQILSRIPEGFVSTSDLAKLVQVNTDEFNAVLADAQETGVIGVSGHIIYDVSRLTEAEVNVNRLMMRPRVPTAPDLDKFPTINERKQARAEWIAQNSGEFGLVFDQLEGGVGHVADLETDNVTLRTLIEAGWLARVDGYVYDPLKIGESTLQHRKWQDELAPIREQIITYLESQPGKTCLRDELYRRFGEDAAKYIIHNGGFSIFSVKEKTKKKRIYWVCQTSNDRKLAQKTARAASKPAASDWESYLGWAGDRLRPGAKDGSTPRNKVVARTYRVKRAASRLGINHRTVERAIAAQVLDGRKDPEGTMRIPAYLVERGFVDADFHEAISAYEHITIREIGLVSGLGYGSIRRRLRRARLGVKDLLWKDICGRWQLPDTLTDFRTRLELNLAESRSEQAARHDRELDHLREQREELRRQQRELRQRLMAAFPTWQHDGRIEQHVSLHLGPPNSGKTHDALDALSDVESGWYLAPLRLLAFEVFDRLNQRGVRCNLLTGEEHIPVEGATVTAATIEMFDPHHSGECVVIDEAQMLADPDRGWAWTRALMEAAAPEIHVIGPETVRHLIERLASSAGLPVSVIHHQRLAPLKVADRYWPLQELPPKTILVAFSRRMVLHLKTELEKMERSVSVIYGGLPPEVRRKQADRFADGETDICVATDAVGMGLNLPADYVCFFEVEKFDGYTNRMLKPAEIQQIGGRAGRYGIRNRGEVGATTRRNLEIVRELYGVELEKIPQARIAPSVEDLNLLPGSLWERLSQWAQLESIPDALREVIRTADLTERVELARMLSDDDVERIGLEQAVTLTNAPTRQSSRAYWYSCAQAILRDKWMPLPPAAPAKVRNSKDLELAEDCIACADIYLWLANRREFTRYAEDEYGVREQRLHWSMQIDEALLQQIDTLRRCQECGRPLAIRHRYSICNACYYNS